MGMKITYGIKGFQEPYIKGLLSLPLHIRQISPIESIKNSELLEVRMNNKNGTPLINFYLAHLLQIIYLLFYLLHLE